MDLNLISSDFTHQQSSLCVHYAYRESNNYALDWRPLYCPSLPQQAPPALTSSLPPPPPTLSARMAGATLFARQCIALGVQPQSLWAPLRPPTASIACLQPKRVPLRGVRDPSDPSDRADLSHPLDGADLSHRLDRSNPSDKSDPSDRSDPSDSAQLPTPRARRTPTAPRQSPSEGLKPWNDCCALNSGSLALVCPITARPAEGRAPASPISRLERLTGGYPAPEIDSSQALAHCAVPGAEPQPTGLQSTEGRKITAQLAQILSHLRRAGQAPAYAGQLKREMALLTQLIGSLPSPQRTTLVSAPFDMTTPPGLKQPKQHMRLRDKEFTPRGLGPTTLGSESRPVRAQSPAWRGAHVRGTAPGPVIKPLSSSRPGAVASVSTGESPACGTILNVNTEGTTGADAGENPDIGMGGGSGNGGNTDACAETKAGADGRTDADADTGAGDDAGGCADADANTSAYTDAWSEARWRWSRDMPSAAPIARLQRRQRQRQRQWDDSPLPPAAQHRRRSQLDDSPPPPAALQSRRRQQKAFPPQPAVGHRHNKKSRSVPASARGRNQAHAVPQRMSRLAPIGEPQALMSRRAQRAEGGERVAARR